MRQIVHCFHNEDSFTCEQGKSNTMIFFISFFTLKEQPTFLIYSRVSVSDLAFIIIAYEKFKLWNVQENWNILVRKCYCKKILGKGRSELS